ncbi:hypothetical protein [Williamsia sp.]|uniref:hypothetical protein n=1 Tax=Williamsia sp. TaxID=1872085 RepID=UPI002F938152
MPAGSSEGLSGRIDDTVDDVLEGTTLVATAVGIIAQVRDSDIDEARLTLMRLARARGVTPTEHARAILDAQRRAHKTPPRQAFSIPRNCRYHRGSTSASQSGHGDIQGAAAVRAVSVPRW